MWEPVSLRAGSSLRALPHSPGGWVGGGGGEEVGGQRHRVSERSAAQGLRCVKPIKCFSFIQKKKSSYNHHVSFISYSWESFGLGDS